MQLHDPVLQGINLGLWYQVFISLHSLLILIHGFLGAQGVVANFKQTWIPGIKRCPLLRRQGR